MLVENTINTFNRLDYAFNNAGVEGVSATTQNKDWIVRTGSQRLSGVCPIPCKGMYRLISFNPDALLKGIENINKAEQKLKPKKENLLLKSV